MKKYYLFIALAMVAAMSVSCKNNNKKAKEASEANAEVVAAAKTILADDVLAKIDEFAKSYIDEAGKFDVKAIYTSALTDNEKLVKPDYLLDPNTVNDMVTKPQKVAALAIIWIEKYVREVYDMPVEETDAAITRLIAELNHPIDIDDAKDMQPSERTKATYEKCKENGELAYFWQFAFAVQTELKYLIANNPEPFFRNITEEQYAAFHTRFHSALDAVKTLAEYDDEMKMVLDSFNSAYAYDESGVDNTLHDTLEEAKVDFPAKLEKYTARRTALLK